MVTPQANRAGHSGGKRYRHLFEHAPICIFVIDLSVSPETVLAANRRAELVYGYPAAELVGLPADRLVADEARPATLTIMRRVQRGETVTAETLHRRRDGTRFPGRVIAAPDPTENGQMIVTVEDITAERQRRNETEAIASDRLRIAQEIHDGVAQNLAGLRFKSALWSHMASMAPQGMGDALDELQEVLITTIADIRRAIFALRPVDLDALGFFPALRQLVTAFGDQNQVVAQLEISGPQDSLPAAYELPIFRIIQEGLNNISRHAQASSVLVRFDLDPAHSLAVLVRDNGCGFDPSRLGPADQSGHFGLRQMRERILDRGGTLDICSTLGQGTELRITLPQFIQESTHAAN